MAGVAAKVPVLINTAIAKARPKFATFVKYAKVELIPPKPSELGEVAAGFGKLMSAAKSGKWKQLTVKEAWLNTLIAAEVWFCFFIGETIGKRSLVGYKV